MSEREDEWSEATERMIHWTKILEGGHDRALIYCYDRDGGISIIGGEFDVEIAGDACLDDKVEVPR